MEQKDCGATVRRCERATDGRAGEMRLRAAGGWGWGLLAFETLCKVTMGLVSHGG